MWWVFCPAKQPEACAFFSSSFTDLVYESELNIHLQRYPGSEAADGFVYLVRGALIIVPGIEVQTHFILWSKPVHYPFWLGWD